MSLLVSNLPSKAVKDLSSHPIISVRHRHNETYSSDDDDVFLPNPLPDTHTVERSKPARLLVVEETGGEEPSLSTPNQGKLCCVCTCNSGVHIEWCLIITGVPKRGRRYRNLDETKLQVPLSKGWDGCHGDSCACTVLTGLVLLGKNEVSMDMKMPPANRMRCLLFSHCSSLLTWWWLKHSVENFSDLKLVSENSFFHWCLCISVELCIMRKSLKHTCKWNVLAACGGVYAYMWLLVRV